MHRFSLLKTLASLSAGARYTIAVGASVLCFIIFGIVLIQQPSAAMTALTVFLPFGMLLLGAIWGLMRLTWYHCFLPPSVLFVVFCFTRLNGFASMIYLLGYIPICLAGALVTFSMLKFLQNRDAYAEEETIE